MMPFKASYVRYRNLKRIVPNISTGLLEDGKNYDDLGTLLASKFRGNTSLHGSCSQHIGVGFMKYIRPLDKEGAVYTPVAKERQKNSLDFVQKAII